MLQEMPVMRSGGGGGYTFDVYEPQASNYTISFKPTHDKWLININSTSNDTIVWYHDDNTMSDTYTEYRNGTKNTGESISSRFTILSDGTYEWTGAGSNTCYVIY